MSSSSASGTADPSDSEPLWPAAPPRTDINPLRNLSPSAPTTTPAAILPAELVEKGKALTDALLLDGAVEEAYAAYAQDAFARTDTLVICGTFITDLFASDIALLARLVRIPDLAFELRHRCAEVSRVVVARWSEAGEIHQLTKLADALLPQPHHFANVPAAEVMASLAFVLALPKPRRASELLQFCKPQLSGQTAASLLPEVERWVEAGNLINRLPASDRPLWITRLRQPKKTWSWDSDEERAALEALLPLLDEAPKSAPLFRATIEGADLPAAETNPAQPRRATPATASPAAAANNDAEPANGSAAPYLAFIAGLPCGALAMAMAEYLSPGLLQWLASQLLQRVG